MASTLEYMQFATGVYAASKDNKIDAPTGWTRTDWQADITSGLTVGFSAGCYMNRGQKGSASQLILNNHATSPTH